MTPKEATNLYLEACKRVDALDERMEQGDSTVDPEEYATAQRNLTYLNGYCAGLNGEEPAL